MKITLSKSVKATPDCDLLIAGAFSHLTPKKSPKPSSKSPEKKFDACESIKHLDNQMKGFLTEEALAEGFFGEEKQYFVTSTLGQLKAKHVSLVGLGDAGKQSVDLYRRLGGQAYQVAQN